MDIVQTGKQAMAKPRHASAFPVPHSHPHCKHLICTRLESRSLGNLPCPPCLVRRKYGTIDHRVHLHLVPNAPCKPFQAVEASAPSTGIRPCLGQPTKHHLTSPVTKLAGWISPDSREVRTNWLRFQTAPSWHQVVRITDTSYGVIDLSRAAIARTDSTGGALLRLSAFDGI